MNKNTLCLLLCLIVLFDVFIFRPFHSSHVHVYLTPKVKSIARFQLSPLDQVPIIKSILRKNQLECTLCLRNLEHWLCFVLYKFLLKLENIMIIDYVHVLWSARRSSLREVKCLFGGCEKFSEIVTIFSRSSSFW